MRKYIAVLFLFTLSCVPQRKSPPPPRTDPDPNCKSACEARDRLKDQCAFEKNAKLAECLKEKCDLDSASGVKECLKTRCDLDKYEEPRECLKTRCDLDSASGVKDCLKTRCGVTDPIGVDECVLRCEDAERARPGVTGASCAMQAKTCDGLKLCKK